MRSSLAIHRKCSSMTILAIGTIFTIIAVFTLSRPTIPPIEYWECPTGYGKIDNSSSILTLCAICPNGTQSIKISASPDHQFQIVSVSEENINLNLSCQDCVPGTYSNEQRVCVECEVGLYSMGFKQTYCDSCAPGFAANREIGASACLICDAGKFSDGNQTEECLICPPGTYSNQGQSYCDICPEGEYGFEAGAASCLSCSEGRYSGRYDYECFFCEPGKYSFENAASCDECGPGTFTGVRGSYTCNDCPAGKYAEQSGSSFCEICRAGKYSSSDTRATSCLNCTDDNDACKSCPNGFVYLDPRNPMNCSPCQKGEYWYSDSGISECLSCLLGKFSDEEGISYCIECPIGSFNNQSGSTFCEKCPIGFYGITRSSEADNVMCEKCPDGTTTRSTGSSSLDDCIAVQQESSSGSSDLLYGVIVGLSLLLFIFLGFAVYYFGIYKKRSRKKHSKVSFSDRNLLKSDFFDQRQSMHTILPHLQPFSDDDFDSANELENEDKPLLKEESNDAFAGLNISIPINPCYNNPISSANTTSTPRSEISNEEYSGGYSLLQFPDLTYPKSNFTEDFH